MLGFEGFFNLWMTLAAVLIFLKVKKLIKWDWAVVVAPVCIGFLMKGLFIFLNRV